MDVLSNGVLVSALTAAIMAPVSLTAAAAMSQDGEMPDPREKAVAQQAKLLCASTDEYIQTLTFLRTTKSILLPEKSARWWPRESRAAVTARPTASSRY
ncbi:MAG: hypothetical protein HC902_06120 [Calothrix sp. SM1_5_4]|nr:hypothetical protein [Calothrix sp. SM1_5_4]